MSETSFFEQQDGSKIAYKILKSANAKNEVPLVMIIGLSTTKEQFYGFEKELAKYQQVIVFDNRGIGESTVASPNDPMTLELLAQDTIGLIKHLGIKKFNLLGEAMGARIGVLLSLKLSSDLKLEKLIIINSAPRIDTNSKVVQAVEALYESSTFSLPKTVQEQKDEFLKGERDPILAKYLLEHPDKLEQIAEITVNLAPRRPLEIMKRQWEANKSCDLTPRLKEIQTPTLIIHGESNTTVPIENAEIFNREIPNSVLIKVPNAGHSVFITSPEIANKINEFCN
ncbi:alpha/beta hydrolase [Gigaspora margarita]|uniref:Alpha/beta hydrolase n=1 Tax=Gigaspora margarita TaxID=4874 RepID=A0A8H4ADZ0_GIGMA|nr:alpha/beta hydrolase [Gigaspora margarita]